MDTPKGHEQNADQIAYWNGPGGQRWADRQAAQDILLRPIADLLIDRAKPKTGERVIDVGCGSGATSIAFARKVAPSGHVFGIDVSGPMLERARQSAPKELPVDFVLADATVYPFDPGKLRSAGLAVRRDVLCRSGAVVHQSAQGAAAIGTAGVRLLARAERKSVLHGAAAGGLQARAETAAAGAGRSRAVRVCLRGARQSHPRRGRFHGIAMEPCNLALDVAIGRGLEAAVQSALEIGPASRALEGQPPEVRAAATNSVREALAPYRQGRYGAAAGVDLDRDGEGRLAGSGQASEASIRRVGGG